MSMLIVFACLIQNDPQIIKGSVFGLFLFLMFFGATWLEVSSFAISRRRRLD